MAGQSAAPEDVQSPRATRNRSEKREEGYSQSSRRQSPGNSQDPVRPLPQSLDAEKGVLSSMMASPVEVVAQVIEKLGSKEVAVNFFHYPAHRILFDAIVDLWNDTQAIDLITLTQTLEDRGELANVGGPGTVAELIGFVPTAANAGFYLEILREKHLLRRIIDTCTECIDRAYGDQEDVNIILDQVEQNVLAIAEDRFKDEVISMRQEVLQAINTIEELCKNRGQLTGIATGFADLDNLTSGLHPGEMFVIAARPSMGKTALAMNIAEHVAIHEEKPVAVFSLEMSRQQLVQRLLCSIARVNLKSTRDGMLPQGDFPKLINAADKLSSSRMLIDDTPGLSVMELRAKARRMKAQYDIELIIVDYLQLLRSLTRRSQDNRQLEITEVSQGIKALAKELHLPIIVLAQLNRQPEARKGGTPKLSDLRESGAIEQDADVVGLLVRPEVYRDDEDDDFEDKTGIAELIIAKQRNGPIGDVPLTFLKEFTRFQDRARVEEPV